MSDIGPKPNKITKEWLEKKYGRGFSWTIMSREERQPEQKIERREVRRELV